MLAALLQLALLGSTSAWGPLGLWNERNGTTDEEGKCTCEALLPDSTFPMKDLIQLEKTTEEVNFKLQIEMSKMETYEAKITGYAEKIMNLTGLTEMMEKDPNSYSEAFMQGVKVEIKQMEALIMELHVSVQTSTTTFESLREQIKSMLVVLIKLEKYDKNLVLVTRREFVKIQLQLEECERRHNELFNPNIGSCKHGGISRISKPIVSQLNAHLNSNYRWGGWGKDSKPTKGSESMYWYSGYTSANIVDMRFYANYKDLILRSPFKSQAIQSGWHGTGNNFVVRDNTLYYQINNPFSMAKINFTTMSYAHRVIPMASSRFSYSHGPNQNLDFAADESGLWVIYASEESKGKMIVAKINEESFGIEDTWETTVFKPAVSNAFMVCGVLYAVRTVDIHYEEIFYTYDTRTKMESYLTIPFERFRESYVNLDYNPTDQKLYMYNDGYYVSYHLWFNQTTKATHELLM